MVTVTISMPESLRTFVDEQVKSKGFGNVSEYFRSLLREAQQKEGDAALERLLIQGLESGPSEAVNEDFWKDLRKEANRLVQERKQA